MCCRPLLLYGLPILLQGNHLKHIHILRLACWHCRCVDFLTGKAIYTRAACEKFGKVCKHKTLQMYRIDEKCQQVWQQFNYNNVLLCSAFCCARNLQSDIRNARMKYVILHTSQSMLLDSAGVTVDDHDINQA